ncbi:NAD-dependent epimerase/dehydratase family protein [Pelagibacteraceae bacterium]|nr:NAD-dependent epimerase/dehydratase family protein [Pelagibacteraceae bacterium]
MKIVITGADGFIGSNLSNALINKNFDVLNIVKKNQSNKNKNFIIKKIHRRTNWSKIFKNYDILIHCAGISSNKNIKSKNDIDNLYEINTYCLENLIDEAFRSGIKKIIFFSTFKILNNENYVKNEGYFLRTKFDYYTHSKFLAEKILINKAKKYKNKIIILRIPAVYGKNMKGGLNLLTNLIRKKIPLPFKFINNKKSFLGLKNLTDLILYLCSKPEKKYDKDIFNIADIEILSTEKLIYKISKYLNIKCLIFYFPKIIIKIFSKIFGFNDLYISSYEDLYFDCENDYNILDWYPKFSLDNQLKEYLNDTFL